MNYIKNTMGTNLSNINPGCYAEITGINGGANVRDKVLSMGLLPGKTVQVVSKQNRGPVIIKINDTRLVLGRGMSEKILVSLKHCELNFDDTH